MQGIQDRARTQPVVSVTPVVARWQDVAVAGSGKHVGDRGMLTHIRDEDNKVP